MSERMTLRQSAVILARVLAFIEYADLVSGAKASAVELVRKLTERYNFVKYPKSADELDLSKGVEFLEGAAGGYPIQKLAIWENLIVVETRVSTNISKAVVEEMLSWAGKEFGLNYPSTPIKRFAYISDVTFYSDAPILDVNPAVRELAQKCSAALSDIWQESVNYEPFTVRVGHDPNTRKNPIASFVIERRKESRFSENKYFSEAPLPTDTHWELLEQFEKNISQKNTKS
jgi:hypothetical protein